MELFRLLGKIAIDNTEANQSLDDTAKNQASKIRSIRKIRCGSSVHPQIYSKVERRWWNP